MQRKYVWMALSIVAMWLAVLFIALFGPTIEVTGAGEEYGLDFETQPLAAPIGYFALIATLFILVPTEEKRGKGADMRKKYAWATLSIAAMWLAVLLLGSFGLTFEVTSTAADHSLKTETWPLAIPITLFTMAATVLVAKLVANFGLRHLASRPRPPSDIELPSMGEDF